MAEHNRDNDETNGPVSPSTASPSTAGSDSVIFTVGIGASAGGLEALQEFFQHMPADSGMAFVVVTHQHPGHTSLLPELLSRTTKMPVTQANDGERLRPNHVYIGPSGGYLSLMNGALVRMDPESSKSPKLPIDHFFRSLAEDQRERAICIILSGTGTDGTLGLKAVKGESGMAMVERPNSAKYAGMPSSAIATGISDYVLTPAEMPDHLIAYAHGPYARVATSDEPTVPAEPMQKIFWLLRNHTGHDFSAYKKNTLCRRIQRRMNVHQIEGPHQYVRYLQEHPHEIDMLFKELLISVTSFFRDPEAWRALATPLERLVQSQAEGEAIRAWVPGCARGEEVYSLAILLRESMQKLDRHLSVQVFGTDLDIKAIEVARFGEYPGGIAIDVDDQRLEKFFVHADDHYRIRKEIRQMSIFAAQNVIRDPPFTKLNIISCRNLLIYLNSDLQKKLMPIFHNALKPEGLLFLGPSETIGTFTELFEVIDKRAKIFRRREVPAATAIFPEIPAQAVFGPKGSGATTPLVEANKQGSRLSAQIERLLLHRFVPTSVIVNDRGEIVYIHGRTGMYLEPTEGQPRANILEMAREGLKFELAAAIRQCSDNGAEVVRENVRVKSNGEFVYVQLSVSKLAKPESLRGLLLVTLRPGEQSDSPQPDATGDKLQRPDQDQHLGTFRDFFESIVETVHQPLVVLDDHLRVVSANQNFIESFDLIREQVVGKLLAEIGGGDWNIPVLMQRLESIFLHSRAMENLELRWNFSTVGPRALRISARRVEREKGLPAILLMAIEVVTAPMQDNDAGQGIVNS